MLWRLILMFGALLVASFIFTQIIWPSIMGRGLFPMVFMRKAHDKLAHARNTQNLAKLNREAARLEAEASFLEASAERFRTESSSTRSSSEEPSSASSDETNATNTTESKEEGN